MDNSQLMIQEVETNIIGKDVFWDIKLQKFRKKRLNLDKIPMRFRCPSCGKIVVKPRDREPLIIRDEQAWKNKKAEIDRLFKLEKPPRSEWDAFVERHKELFEVDTIEIPRDPAWWLGFYGGVCKDCWLDGFGRYGDYGGFVGRQIKPKEEERRKKHEKHEQEEIVKYGKEPKYWLDPGFTKNPEWQEWWQKHIEIDRDSKRKKNAKFVESTMIIIKQGLATSPSSGENRQSASIVKKEEIQ